MNPVCILMAAGASKRFGSNKLFALYRGKALYLHALDALPAEQFSAVIVVSGYDEVLGAANARGFIACANREPEAGVSRTVRLGLEEAMRRGAAAAMFMVADQPRLRRESILALLADYAAHPEHIVSLAFDARRGNPVLFPARFFPELCALEGDRGGSAVIRRHEDALRLVQIADARELADVDEAGQLADGSEECRKKSRPPALKPF